MHKPLELCFKLTLRTTSEAEGTAILFCKNWFKLQRILSLQTPLTLLHQHPPQHYRRLPTKEEVTCTNTYLTALVLSVIHRVKMFCLRPCIQLLPSTISLLGIICFSNRWIRTVQNFFSAIGGSYILTIVHDTIKLLGVWTFSVVPNSR
jgi:hypothetical protein